MICSSSDSCNRLVAGKYDILLDENPAPIKETLNKYLQLFGQLELEQQAVCSTIGQDQPVDSKLSDSAGYNRQFKQLRELSKTLKLDRNNLRVGELDCNQRKNRYQDIIPFNHTRVVLNGSPNTPGSDYINANFVAGSSGSPRAYIACQGPLKRTLNDFWRMIWECNVSVIIMACNEFESGQLKCELYWPEVPNRSRLFGNYEVTLVKVRQICDDFMIRKFSVKLLQINNQPPANGTINNNDDNYACQKATTDSSCCSSSASTNDDGDRITRSDEDSDSYHLGESSSGTPDRHACGHHQQPTDAAHNAVVLEERTICQFHYTTWPDHGVPPSVQPILELLRLVRDVQPAEDKPILVHCSAGCGRTGTICCIDYVWGLLRRCRLEPSFDLYHIISEMRKQRMSMVQTLEQYVLCHRAVAALFADQLSLMHEANIYDDIVELTSDGSGDFKKPLLMQPEDIDDEQAFEEDDENCGPVFI